MTQRQCMIALIAAIAVAAAMTTGAATNHVVGGSTGWTIPSSASLYSQWASAQTFTVGDTLLFNFTTGLHNVMEVPKSSYDSCSSSNKIGSTLATGPATVTLTKPGSHYYVCGVTGHCNIGQKLAINVAGKASSSSPAAAPKASAPPAASPASSPSAAPVPAAGAPTVSSPGPAPGPAASAPAPAATTVSSPSPAPAPAASAPAAATPAASSAAPAAAPTADGPGGALAPSSSSGSGASAGPASSTQNPTAVAGPADGGPSPSSAPSLLLSSGYSRSAVIAAALLATAAFLL